MNFWYISTGCFDYTDGDAWESYKADIQLPQLVEVVSLDGVLNQDLNTENSVNISEYAVIENDFAIGLYTSLDYVKSHTPPGTKFNLLTVLKNPPEDCSKQELKDFDFIGYDLLDTEYLNSTITNCGGYYDVYSPNDINKFGLITDFCLAMDIRKRLKEQNPGDNHADTNMFAVWRHKYLGQTELINDIKSKFHNISISITGFDEPNNGRELHMCRFLINGEDVTEKYFGSWNRLNHRLDKFLFDSPDGKYLFIPAENNAFLIDTTTLEKIELPYKALSTLTFFGNMFSETHAYVIYYDEVAVYNITSKKCRTYNFADKQITNFEISTGGKVRVHFYEKDSNELVIKHIRT